MPNIDLDSDDDNDGHPYRTPFQQKYFSTAMMNQYEPLVDAMAQMEETGGADAIVCQQFEEHWGRFMDFSWCSKVTGKMYDIVFYGMSGYSGYLIMEFLKRNQLRSNRAENFTFAFAGRRADKVAYMRDREFAGTRWADTPVIEADFQDVVSVIDLVKSAHVIVNVAGPYMLTEGEVLIDACIWCKTDYVDISQELPWSMRVKELHKYARDAGVMIVPGAASGAYADLGVYLLAKQIKEDSGEATRRAVCYYSGGGNASGVSGGTLKTRATLEEAEADKDARLQMEDPFVLGGFVPSFDRNGRKSVNIEYGTGIVTPKIRDEDLDSQMARVTEDPKLGVWRAPFGNAQYDARMVRRSNMLHADLGDQPYGTAFNFQAFAMLPREEIAAAKAAKKRGAEVTVGTIGKYGIPQEEEDQRLKSMGKTFAEGDGPEVQNLSDAWSSYSLYAESMSGNLAKCSFVTADGYFESARMAVSTAMALRFDRSRLPYRGGVLTPSTACGAALVERLVASGAVLKMGAWADLSMVTPPSLDAN